MSALPVEHVLLDGISWETYGRLCSELQRRRVRLTYDRGRLEIMSPGQSHERERRRIGRLIEAVTEEFGLPLQGNGSTTWQREDLQKGLEPDECYWIQHAAEVRGRTDLDLRFDPPPDLAVEVEVSSRSLDRMPIYAALGVPEVWRWHHDQLELHLLDERGSYLRASRSRAIVGFPVADLVPWLIQGRELEENEWIREVRGWLRARTSP